MQLETSVLENFGIETRKLKNYSFQLFYEILADLAVCGSLGRQLSGLWVTKIVGESPNPMQHVKKFQILIKVHSHVSWSVN